MPTKNKVNAKSREGAPARTAPKKSATKVVAKKTAIKKVASKSVKGKQGKQGKSLVYATNKTSFWVNDGQVLNSLVALKDAFDKMEKAVFTHHVTKDKNDFAQWVGDVLCDADCATALKTAKTPKTAKTVVVRHLKSYTL